MSSRELRVVRSVAGFLVRALLVAGFALVGGCVYFSRSGLVKMRAYDFEALPHLDIGAIRIAVEHDTRSAVDLQRTGIVVVGGRDAHSRNTLYRFRTVVVAEGQAPLEGLLRAATGRKWTILGINGDDLPLAREIQKSIRARDPANFDIDIPDAEVSRWFPTLERSAQGHNGLHFSFETHLDFLAPSVVSRATFPLAVWLLMNPRDGFFKVIQGSIELDQQYSDPAH